MKNTKLTKTIMLSALAAVAFGGIAAGTTYALFTSEADANVTVAAGKVAVKAEIQNLKLYSLDAESGEVAELASADAFTNGGTVAISGTNVSLSNITPGDKVEFELKVANESTVAIKYRTVIESLTDAGLFSGLNIKINSNEFDGERAASDYQKLEVGSEPIVIPVSIELPSDAGNDYQEKSCSISCRIEAVQGNAVGYPMDVSTVDDFKAALEAGEPVSLVDDIELDSTIGVTKDVVIYGNGKTLKAAAGSSQRIMNINSLSEDVTVSLTNVNLDAPGAERGISIGGNTGNVKLVLDNCICNADHYSVNVASNSGNVELVVKNSDITGYCASQTWTANSKLTFENCTLTGLNKWSGSDDDFAVINVETAAAGSEINLLNCKIIATEKGTAKEYFVYMRADCTVNVTGCTFEKNGVAITGDDIGANFAVYEGVDYELNIE